MVMMMKLGTLPLKRHGGDKENDSIFGYFACSRPADDICLDSSNYGHRKNSKENECEKGGR